MAGEAKASKRVVILDGGYGDYQAEWDLITGAGYRLEVFEGDRHDLDGKLAFARGAEGVFVRWSEFGDYAFDRLPGLRCLVRYGVGYDNVDLAAATAHGVKVCNVQGYASHSVSDHALMLILACQRGLLIGARSLREIYNRPPRTDIPELKDMVLGIVGLGRIGGTLFRKAQGLFREVWAFDPYISKARFSELGAREMAWDALLSESDVISIHCNLTDETRGMFDAAALSRMKPTAILVNTARGPVVDEDALTSALETNKLYAAGVDVYDDEPPRENRDALLAHPHFVGTGHYAWFSVPAHLELQRRAAENMVAMLQGETPEDCLNP